MAKPNVGRPRRRPRRRPYESLRFESKHWVNFGAQALAPYHKEKFASDAERLFYNWQRGRQ